MIITIFDTETTGLTLPSNVDVNEQPRIIELGGVKFNQEGGLDRLEQLIDPGMEISSEITKITGISTRDVSAQPTFEDYLPAWQSFMDGTDVLVAHNAPFDVSVLEAELSRASCFDFPWPINVICTAQEYHPICGFRPTLKVLYEYVMNRMFVQTHRALDDCLALHQLLLKDQFFQKVGLWK